MSEDVVHEGQHQRVCRVEIIRDSRVRRAANGWGLGAALAVLTLITLVAVGSPQPPISAVELGSILALLALGAAAGVASLLRTRHRGFLGLACAHDALRVVDAHGRARWSVRWTHLGLVWLRAPLLVELATALGDEAHLYFASPEEAAAAVRAIRARSRDRRAYPLSLETDSRRIRRKAFGWLLPAILGPLALAIGGAAAWPAVPVALVLGWLLGRGEHRITLGADGVIVERGARRIYLPYREIEAIELRARMIGGRSLVLRASGGRRVRIGAQMDRTRAALAEALLREGLRMVENGASAGASSAALAHDGETPGELLSAIRSASKRAGYRAAALDAERLVSIVRNPAADGTQRIAAALALRGEPTGPARIRVAAEVSAEPDVRDALEALAAESVDEVRVARALERLSSGRR